MAAYYNQSRRPIPLGFSDGRVLLSAPGTKIEINAADEGFASVQDAIRSGDLVKLAQEEVVSSPATKPVVIATEPVTRQQWVPRRNRKGR